MASSFSSTEHAAPGGPKSAKPDWTVQVADTIESVVSSVRDKTATPLETVARALVYGVLIAGVGTMALVLTIIVIVRLASLVMPVWSVYLILGGLFTAIGVFLWRKRRPAGDRSAQK